MNVPYRKRKLRFSGMGFGLGSHDAFGCHVSIVSFKFLHLFHDLDITGQLICRIFSSLGLSDVSPQLDSGYTVL